MVVKRLKFLVLTVLCLIGGYGFHKMNPHDPIVSIFFTIGLLGIMMSALRKPRD